jgi:fibronectin type 3 domain-containing protein
MLDEDLILMITIDSSSYNIVELKKTSIPNYSKVIGDSLVFMKEPKMTW